MERLTERTADGILVKECFGDDVLKTLYQCYGAEPMPHYANCDEGYCAMEKLAEYEDLEEQGKLLKLPCRPGDYALLSNGSIVPVIYVTYTEDDIEVGCQNGIHVSMGGRSAYRCSGFYRTRREAQEALERMGNETGCGKPESCGNEKG